MKETNSCSLRIASKVIGFSHCVTYYFDVDCYFRDGIDFSNNLTAKIYIIKDP